MGRRAGEKPVQFSLSAPAMAALDIAASYHKSDVDRDRPMNKGPMLAYVARWFVSLPREGQLEVILAGKELTERDASGAEISPFGVIRRPQAAESTTNVPIYGDEGSPGAKPRAVRSRKK